MHRIAVRKTNWRRQLPGNKSMTTKGIAERATWRAALSLLRVPLNRSTKSEGTVNERHDPPREPIEPPRHDPRNKWFVVICTQWARATMAGPWVKDEWLEAGDRHGCRDFQRLIALQFWQPWDETSRETSVDWDTRSKMDGSRWTLSFVFVSVRSSATGGRRILFSEKGSVEISLKERILNIRVWIFIEIHIFMEVRLKFVSPIKYRNYIAGFYAFIDHLKIQNCRECTWYEKNI